MSNTVVEELTWDDLYAGKLQPDQRVAVFRRSAAEFDAFLASEPDAAKEVQAIVDRRLVSPPDSGTFGTVFDSLKALLGGDAANVLHWWIMGWPDGNAEVLEAEPSSRVLALMQWATASFGTEWKAAFGAWRELPDDWKNVERDVFFDLIKQQYRARVRVEKYNGERVVVEGNPDSLLFLARSLVVTLKWFPTADAYSQPQIDAFLAEVEPLLRTLRREPEPETVSASDGAAQV